MGILFLVGISASPNDHGERKEYNQSSLGTESSVDTLDIKSVTPDTGKYNLSQVVEDRVKGLGAGIESSTVDRVLLIGVKLARRPEHGEEEQDERVELHGLVEPDEFRLPTRVLLQDDAGSVWSDNIVGVAEEESEDSSSEHEHDEGDVGSIGDSAVSRDLDILADRDLRNIRRHSKFKPSGNDAPRTSKLTKPPITAPMLKIPQNQAKYRPFWPSLGYEIMIVP